MITDGVSSTVVVGRWLLLMLMFVQRDLSILIVKKCDDDSSTHDKNWLVKFDSLQNLDR